MNGSSLPFGAVPGTAEPWPLFPVGDWQGTCPTLHRWFQIVGKIRLALSPPMNQYWHVVFYVSARGLTTSALPYGAERFEISFDFVDHQVRFATSWGPIKQLPLRSESVSAFYNDVLQTLEELGIHVPIWPRPVEISDTTPFQQDFLHASYDPAAAQAFWRVLARADTALKQFRGRFRGKCSPVHFFWGSMDLAVTRFSGRPAPPFTGPSLNVNPRVMQESYSQEVCSAGFWPGNESVPASFYCYAVPQPAGFTDASVSPPGAYYGADMGEFLLPYGVVQTSATPDETLLTFLESTYAAAADLGHWDRSLVAEPMA